MPASVKRNSRSGRRDAVINLRIPTQVRDTIDSAAGLLGKTRSAFIIESSHLQATDVLLDRRIFTLGAKQYDAFVQALQAKPKSNAKLKSLFAGKSTWEV